jgi:hypothetical protein
MFGTLKEKKYKMMVSAFSRTAGRSRVLQPEEIVQMRVAAAQASSEAMLGTCTFTYLHFSALCFTILFFLSYCTGNPGNPNASGTPGNRGNPNGNPGNRGNRNASGTPGNRGNRYGNRAAEAVWCSKCKRNHVPGNCSQTKKVLARKRKREEEKKEKKQKQQELAAKRQKEGQAAMKKFVQSIDRP